MGTSDRGDGSAGGSLRIKDWERFQHYKHYPHGKGPGWIKLYTQLLDDPDWFALSGNDAKLLVGLWMMAAGQGGHLPCSRKIAFRLRKSEKEILESLERLTHWVYTSSRRSLDVIYTASMLEEKRIEKKRKKDREGNSRNLRARALPEDWKPRFIDTSNSAVHRELDKMRDWALAGGHMKVDWEAAFRNWCRRANVEYCEPRNNFTRSPLQFYAAFGTPELEAWDAHSRATTGKNLPRDRKGGWLVPTRWPVEEICEADQDRKSDSSSAESA